MELAHCRVQLRQVHNVRYQNRSGDGATAAKSDASSATTEHSLRKLNLASQGSIHACLNYI
jgi:hypothetical protein